MRFAASSMCNKLCFIRLLSAGVAAECCSSSGAEGHIAPPLLLTFLLTILLTPLAVLPPLPPFCLPAHSAQWLTPCDRAPAGEEVYSFRQVTEYPSFTPQTLAAINIALKSWAVWQKKQSLQKPAKYAAVHEARSAEDRRTAAELAARLTKLRTEHADSAAQVASEVSQPSGGSGNQKGTEAVEHVVKEKRSWSAKVSDAPMCEKMRPQYYT